jgi:hypothetical protein
MGVPLERVAPLHHVDRVDEELRRDPRLALVLAEPEEAEAGMTTTEGLLSRSAGTRDSANALVVGAVVVAVGRDARRNRAASEPGSPRRLDSHGTNIGEIAGVRRKVIRGISVPSAQRSAGPRELANRSAFRRSCPDVPR